MTSGRLAEISRDAPRPWDADPGTAMPETMQIAFAVQECTGWLCYCRSATVFCCAITLPSGSFRPVPVIENRVVPELVRAGAEQVATLIRLRVDASADLPPENRRVL